VRGNSHAPFGNRPTEKDPNQRHLAGGRVHAGGGSGKPTGGNTGRAPRVDLTATQPALATGWASGSCVTSARARARPGRAAGLFGVSLNYEH